MASTWGASWGTSWGTSWDRVYVPPVEAEDASTAGLRVYAALELPRNLGGSGALYPTLDLREILGTMAELGETATIAGIDVDVVSNTPYLGATLGAYEVQGRVTRLYCAAADFTATSATFGSTVIFRGLTYEIARIEEREPSLIVLELER